MCESWPLRPARPEDAEAISALIERSIRELGAADYTRQQIEGALRGAFGLDSRLISDGTYFVIEHADELAGCGGWSFRRTLFGGDARADRDPARLDPRTDAAKIRAFFVHPRAARRGLGTRLLAHCEHEARRRGFLRTELMATLPGVRLYASRGYVAGPKVQYELEPGLSIEFVPMSKRLEST